MILLAGLGGGCASLDMADGPKPFGQASTGREVPGVEGPNGEPIHVAAGQMPTDSGVKRADARMPAKAKDSGIKQTAGIARLDGMGGGIRTPGVHAGKMAANDGGYPGASPYGPMTHGFAEMIGHGAGVLPVPAMGPPGAVAAVGAIGPHGGMYPPMYANQRTSIRFANPRGMKISWQGPGGSFVETGLESPGRYNFPQGAAYRLRLSGIVKYPTQSFYPTLEIYPATPNTVTYLSHNAVPLTFTDEDFEQAVSGNLVVKVIYLPNQAFQDLAAVAGADELVSTRLEPGVDPLAEANRRGTILAVIRMGNIDLEDRFGPPVDAPHGVGAPPMPPVRPVPPPKKKIDAEPASAATGEPGIKVPFLK
jgi:hypothetical protein